MKNMSSNQLDKALDQIEKSMISKDYEKALELSLAAIDMTPDYSLPYYLSGVIARELNMLVLAEKNLKRAVELDPSVAQFRCDLGCFLANQAKYDSAIPMLHEAVKLDKDFTEAYEQLGAALMQRASAYDIHGWFKPREAAQLFLIASELEEKAPVIVELGSFMGLSAMIFAKALESKPAANISCVDIWAEDGSSVFDQTRNMIIDQHNHGETFYDLFLRRMKKAGIIDKIKPIKSYTTDAAKNWTTPIDLLFIDAEHTYEGAKADYLAWHEFVKPGGYILFHDVIFEKNDETKNTGPGNAVEELVKNNPVYEDCGLYETLYCVRRKK